MTRTRVVANVFVCSMGILLSLYSLHVENSKSTNDDYQALCDISSRVSCSKVFHSEYGRGLGLVQSAVGERSVLVQPNSIYGLIGYSFYAVLTVVAKERSLGIRLVTNVFLLALSTYLAYVLFFVLFDLCIVCVSTYLINIMLLVLSLLEYRAVHVMNSADQSSAATEERAASLKARPKKAD